MTGTVVGSLAINGTVTGAISTDTTNNLYSVSLIAGQTYTFGAAITGGVSSDYLGGASIDLRDSSETLIAATANGNDGDSVAPTFTFTAETSGTYYLAISAGSSEYDNSSTFSAFDYSITVLTTPSSTVVDPFISYVDRSSGAPTPNDVVAAALQYVGKEWAWDNCTGLAWAVGTEVGGPFYESIANVTSTTSIPTVIPDPDAGYVTPLGTDGNWTTYETSNWQSFVQLGDIVRIPANVLSASDPGHSFIIVGGSAGDWEVIDNTNPYHVSGLPGSDAPITIEEHTFNDYPNNSLYTEILNASEAYVSRLNTAGAATIDNMIDSLSAPTLASEAAAVPEQYETVGFYLGRPTASPFGATSAENIIQSGRSLVSIFEMDQNFDDPSYFTTAQADTDAAAAISAAIKISQPFGSAIYFAVDDSESSLNSSDISAIDSYFAEINADFGNLGWLISNVGPITQADPYKIGVYAAGSVLSSVQDEGLSDVSYYWSDPNYLGGSFSGAQITRDTNDVTVAGVDVDTDITSTTEFGQWGTTGGSTLPDIVIDSLQVSPSAALGGALAVSATIGNDSSVAAGAFDVAIYFSTDPHLDSNAHLYYSFEVQSLGAYGSTSWGQSILLPSWITTAGTYYVIVDANQNQSLTESDYDNDSFSSSFAVEASTTTVASGTTITISGGQLSSGMTVQTGGHLIVASGGGASNTLDNGVETVSAGGSDGDALITSGREDDYGVADADIVRLTGLQQVFSGGSASGATISSGGEQYLLANGSATDTIVNSGGYQLIYSGGFAADAVISSGGSQYVSSAGSAADTTLAGDQYVSSGGTADGTIVGSGGYEQIDSQGFAGATVLLSSGEQDVLAGTASGTEIEGGAEYIYSAGFASGTTVSAGSQNIQSGGTSDEITISTGGIGYVGSAGTAGGVVIAGGTFEIASGAHVSGAIAFAPGISGGTLQIDGTAMPSNTISGFNAAENIYLWGIGGGSAGTVSLGANNLLSVVEGGKTYNLQLDPSQSFSGDFFQLNSLGTGTEVDVFSGPITSGATVYISSGQTSDGATILNGGTLNVMSGGTAINTVNDGGIVYVYSGGTQSGGTVTGQGDEIVSGLAISPTVSSASFLTVESGGLMENTTAASASYLTVYLGGVTVDTIVDGGGESVYAGGTSIQDIVSSGGYDTIGSSGTASGVTIDGGTLQLNYDGTISGSVTFGTAGGELKIITLTMPTVTISGFAPGDVVDLSEVYYSSSNAVKLLTGNVVQVSAGGSAYDLQFDQSQNLSHDQFYLATDGYGTEVMVSSSVITISPGQTSSGVGVVSGGILNVLFGGTAAGAIISSGGTAAVSGTASNTVVNGGGSAYVALGGLGVATTLVSGGVAAVSSGGTADDTTISGGGSLTISNGGLADPTIIYSGGSEIVSSGGSDTGALVSGGELDDFGYTSGVAVFTGLEIVEAGGAASNTALANGGSLSIYAGGTASGTRVGAGAMEYVFFGGAAISTTVSSGGVEYVLSGGVDSSATLIGGGEEFVSSGSTAANTTISGGGAFIYGGAVSVTLENGAAFDVVGSGGTASGTTISAGANEFVFSGGLDEAATLSAGTQYVSSGGVASGTTVTGGALQYVEAGGTASNTAISGGGAFVYGSAVSMTLENGAAFGVIAIGGFGSATTVRAGAYEYVFSGATDKAAAVAGGVQNVSSGAMASGATVTGGGLQYVFAGGTASNTTIFGGGAFVYGSAVSMALENGAAFAVIAGGGVASATAVSAGAYEYVFSGAVDRAAAVIGGVQNVSSGALASGAVLSAGALQYVFAGGTASNTTVSGGGALDYGSAVSMTLADAAAFGIVGAGGVASGTTVSSGADEYVFSGAVDRSATVIGGIQNVSSGATASSASLQSGGIQYVFAGGTASNTVISGGGAFIYGSAVSTTIGNAAGFALVESGGVAAGITVSSGANAYVSSGGTDNGATLSGGDIELDSGARGTGTYTFAAGGLLTLDGAGTYGMLVAGFTSASAEIDFSGIASAGMSLTWTQQGTSGTLTVSNGANSASVLLLGTYVASNFNTASAPGGGTIVFDPPLANQVSDGGSAVIASPHQV